jgi:hypothetical protein
VNPRQRTKAPLLGFGPAGYIALAIFLALLIPILLGVDLRYELQKLILYIFGVDAMMKATVYTWIFYFPLFGMSISLITACAGLLAFNFAPFRIKRRIQLAWFALCALWIPLTHLSCYYIIRANPQSPSIASLDGPYQLLVLELLGVIFAGWFAVSLTRSRIVAVSWALALLLNLIQIGQLYAGIFTIFDVRFIRLGYYGFSTYAILLFLCTSASLLAWAIIERRKPIPEIPCPICLYDLVGIPENTPCPECGDNAGSDVDDV